MSECPKCNKPYADHMLVGWERMCAPATERIAELEWMLRRLRDVIDGIGDTGFFDTDLAASLVIHADLVLLGTAEPKLLEAKGTKIK